MLQEIARKMDIPEGRIPAKALFNKITGATIAVMSAENFPDDAEDKFTVVDINFNIKDDLIEGNYPNFRIVSRNDRPPVMTEQALNEMAAGAITKKYPLAKQVTVLAKAVKKIGDETGVELEELEEMLFFIEDTLRKNRLRKEEYEKTNDYQYISDEQLARDEIPRLEGTGHVDLGPRPGAKGVVF